ncbi:hypothetical protein D3C75_1173100 [compost metagenome]
MRLSGCSFRHSIAASASSISLGSMDRLAFRELKPTVAVTFRYCLRFITIVWPIRFSREFRCSGVPAASSASS